MTLYPQLIMDALATVMYAGTKKNIVESGMVAEELQKGYTYHDTVVRHSMVSVVS